MKYLITLVIVSIIFCSCVPKDKLFSIWIKNNSNKNIYFIVNNYVDTLLPLTNKYLIKVEVNDRISIDSHQPWNEVFSAKYPKDTLLIYFFNNDSINKYDWETIRISNKIMEKRIYSKQDLQNSNWYINYP